MPPVHVKKRKISKIESQNEEADLTFNVIWDHEGTLMVSSPICGNVNEV